jgi:eukaryotic-like serine/threonine-protein kinase
MGVAIALPLFQVGRYLAASSAGGNDAGLTAVNRLVLLATVLSAVAIVTTRRLKLATPSVTLRLGMALEVLVAFSLALVETAGIVSSSEAVLHGVSAVGPWLVVAGAFVPSHPRWALAAPLAAATAWPLAYGINVVRAGSGVATSSGATLWALLNYAWALAAYLLNRAVHAQAPSGHPDELGGYHLLTRIAEGGMGEVWKATHKQLARAAAIKIIRVDLTDTVDRSADTAVSRFRREARAIARLQSPHTVYVYDFGVSDDGRFYYAMELLDGISLQALVQTFGQLEPSRAVALLIQMCESLHEAHEVGLVHRDLKPSNVMVCQVALHCDFVKVLDFGLAKNVKDTGMTQLTRAGTTTGTPAYLAPEMARGEGAIDRRTDIYAIGCIAYFLLTGSPVFDDPNPTRLALRHLNDKPEPLSRRSSRPVAPDLEAIVMQCLEKRPDDRPASAAVVADRLAACRVEKWTTGDARRWWERELPPDSPWRAPALGL